MKISHTKLPDVVVIEPHLFGDSRGVFTETWQQKRYAKLGLPERFVQDNLSFSRRGVLRGLHFQIPPFAQAKLVRVIQGAAFDVAVDIRRGSPSYGHYVSLRLSAGDGSQLFIPEGFAHGFCTLEPNTLVAYKVSRYFSPAHDLGVLWNDADIAIDWPLSESEIVLSEKDGKQPSLSELSPYFSYKS